jgi:hypothetical protein
MSAGASGTQTLALIAGGATPPGNIVQSATELYNGTSFTSNPTGLATARFQQGQLGGTGTQTSSLIFGGGPPVSATAATEEWTGPGVATTKTITTS